MRTYKVPMVLPYSVIEMMFSIIHHDANFLVVEGPKYLVGFIKHEDHYVSMVKELKGTDPSDTKALILDMLAIFSSTGTANVA